MAQESTPDFLKSAFEELMLALMLAENIKDCTDELAELDGFDEEELKEMQQFLEWQARWAEPLLGELGQCAIARVEEDWIQYDIESDKQLCQTALLTEALPIPLVLVFGENEEDNGYPVGGDDEIVTLKTAVIQRKQDHTLIHCVVEEDLEGTPMLLPPVALTGNTHTVDIPGVLELTPDTARYSDNEYIAWRQESSMDCVDVAVEAWGKLVKSGAPNLKFLAHQGLCEDCTETAATIQKENPAFDWLLRELEMYCPKTAAITATNAQGEGEHFHIHRGPDGNLAWDSKAWEKLILCLSKGAGFILRSQTEEGEEVRGYACGPQGDEFSYQQIAPEELKLSFSLDAKTGDPIAPPDDAKFC
jgi:hypothetical protein